ncbi:hypothetical protein D4Q80_04710 [bacterium]|nr:MAG: hypothetical protein D4Q80_04710 [bacterium]
MKKTILFVLMFFTANLLFAETIKLKSGSTVEAKILEKTGQYIKVDFQGITLTYFLDEIESIDDQTQQSQAIPAPSIAASVVPQDSLASEVFNKRLQALKEKKRFRRTTEVRMNMSSFMRSAMEVTADFDLGNKIIFSSMKTKEFNFLLSEMFRQFLTRDIENARAKGVPEEKIKEMQSKGEEIIRYSGVASSKASREVEKLQMDIYIIVDTVYINNSGKWAKIKDPSIAKLMEAFASFDLNALNQLSEQESSAKVFGPFAAGLAGMFKDKAAYYGVSEEEFQGGPCYVLFLKPEKASEFAQDSFKSWLEDNPVAKVPGQEFDPNSFQVKSMSAKEYISKDGYRILRAENEGDILLIQPRHPDQKMQFYFKESTSFSYPNERIVLPKEAAEAVLVKSWEEAMQVAQLPTPESLRQPEGQGI